jgi:hypothetical protein
MEVGQGPNWGCSAKGEKKCFLDGAIANKAVYLMGIS